MARNAPPQYSTGLYPRRTGSPATESPRGRLDIGSGELALPLSHYEAATLCGVLAYVSGENDMPPSDDEGVLRDVSARLQTLIRRGGRR